MGYLKYILVIILVSLLFLKPRVYKVSKFEIDLKKDEVLINFIYNNELNALYIQDNGINSLIILNYNVDDKEIENNLIKNGITSVDKIYSITPVLIKLFGIDSEYYITENNLIKLNYHNNNFCIYIEEYQNESDLNVCKFLYMIKFKTGVLKNLIGDPEVIFQNENNPLPIKTQELIYDNWTELYTINNSEHTILKISKEGFDALVISK